MTDLTVSDVAKKLKRSRDRITGLIVSGKLEAYDAAPDGQYRQWRVTPESMTAFRQVHSASALKRPRKQRSVTAAVKEFF